jgi:elongation factor P
MSISPNDLRPGSVFKDSKGNVLQVIETQHVKLSKGGACCRIKFKNLVTGSITEDRFNVNSSFGEVYIDKMNLTYSYTEGDRVFFMNSDYEMLDFPIDSLGTVGNLLKSADGFKEPPQVVVRMFQELESGKSHIIDVELANDIILEVIDTRPSMKGETAKAGTKPAVVQGGLNIKVPTHVQNGDHVLLSKVDFSYLGKK